MTRQPIPEFPSQPRPELLLICGIVGLLGNLAPVVAMVTGWLFTDHDMISDTISDLGRGPHKIIMDTGFFANAAAMLALAIAAAHLHLGRAGWSFGILCLSLLALLTVMIGLWDAFGQTAEGSGMAVHTWLTFGLGPLYLAGPILMAGGIACQWPGWRFVFYGSALGWIVFATWFKLAPNAYDGILEKIAVVATLFWTLPLAWVLMSAGQRARG